MIPTDFNEKENKVTSSIKKVAEVIKHMACLRQGIMTFPSKSFFFKTQASNTYLTCFIGGSSAIISNSFSTTSDIKARGIYVDPKKQKLELIVPWGLTQDRRV